MSKPLLVGLACLALAGCAGNTPYNAPGFTATYAPANGGVTQGTPLALLPQAAGPVLAVNQTRHSNAIQQDIVLGGDQVNGGENKIMVTAMLPPDPTKGNDVDGQIKVDKPTETTIDEEMGPLFPAIPMRISLAFDRNQQGPFGYAIGHGPAGSTCLYAWQYIGPERPLSLLEAGFHQQPISVRVRLCKPRSSEASLVALVRAMVVYAPNGVVAAVPPVAGMSPWPAGDTLAAAGTAPSPYGGPTPYGAPTTAASLFSPAAAPAYATPGPAYPMPVAPAYGAPAMTPGYAYPAPLATVATADAAPAIDEPVSRPARRTRHAAMRRPVFRRIARHRSVVRRTVVQTEAPAPMIGAAIPMPGEGAPAQAQPRASFVLPSRTAAPRPVAAPTAAADTVPLPR